MKTIKLILLLTFSFLLFSCDDDNEASPDFSTASLKQTQWNGTLQETDVWGNGDYIYGVGMVFYSESKGKCSVKKEEGSSPFQYEFEYSTDNKMLIISENNGTLDGHWLLIQSDENKMILEKGTGGEGAYKGVLTLTKVH